MSTEPDAVYFAPQDYAPAWRRFAAFFIDLFAVFCILAALELAAAAAVVPRDVFRAPASPERQQLVNEHLKPVKGPVIWGWFILTVIYHIPFRGTRGGTLGYRIAGIRLVDRTGRPPEMKTLIKRFFLALPGCFLLLLTYLSCFRDPKRQAAHDQWAGTWLVRKRAVPAGPALTEYKTKLFGTFVVTYIDVAPVPDRPDLPVAETVSTGEAP
ncbi:MAG: RDD family protein [Phycisphaerae bacterium]